MKTAQSSGILRIQHRVPLGGGSAARSSRRKEVNGLQEELHLPRKGRLRWILEKGISTEGWGGDAEKQVPPQGCHQPFFSARVTQGDKRLWQRPRCTWGHRDGGPGSKEDLILNRLLTGRGSQTPPPPASSPHPRGHRWGSSHVGALPTLA